MNASTTLAVAVVAALRSAGVSDVVLSPGSRSAALAVALHGADAEGLLRLHVRIDERTAGFLALGLAKGAHRPVAVVTTSGTAVANLHPAVLEAAHAGEPLIVLSADRPSELRRTGANQTTHHQAAMYGAAAHTVDVTADDPVGAADAVADAVRRRGPTQINLQFAEPLLPETLRLDLPVCGRLASGQPTSGQPTFGQPTSGQFASEQAGPLVDKVPTRGRYADSNDESVRLAVGPRTVVVAGDDSGPPARMMAQGANWPLLAEPTSGARTGSHAMRSYRLLLDTDLADPVERVIVTGHPTLSRPVTQLISRSDIEVISVRARSGICTDPGRVARHVQEMPVVDGRDDDDWINRWRAADRNASAALDSLAAADGDALPLQVAAEIGAAVTPGALLVVGSSQPVRDLDLMAPVYIAGQRRLVLGNRGLAGIDGTVSTAIGAALGRQSTRALAYVGDITFLHDMSGLVFGRDEPRPDITIVVANDDGGSIFATLEQGAAAYAGAFERVFATPLGVDLAALCGATRTPYEQVDDVAALRAALARDIRGVRVVEVPIPRANRRALVTRLATLA